ncbi:hypothetical protein KFL_013060020 [Klebsormidium nitens]|uniref:Uncharacterized protein n=1 Tax=Klebsormidium nitens TaxID=105231 RepID=A0A1Y1ISS7_KLENI|nr:hypothetical protein KFL_013060020 [Klebsormidium nitens]|eukprot:GAQ93112.1 hypothetical protein KFL_013060020 [Klebsormidium nitens]
MDPRLHILSVGEERIVATCFADVRDRANSLAAPLIRSLSDRTCTARAVEFRDYMFDKQSLEALSEYLSISTKLERIVFGNGCASEICMAGASLSRVIGGCDRDVFIEGSLPRAMGHVNVLQAADPTGQRLRQALLSFEPDHWAYDWSSDSETLGRMPSVTNGDFFWSRLHPDGILTLNVTDEDMLQVEWSVCANELKSTALQSADDVASFARAPRAFGSLESLTVSSCGSKGLTYFGRHLAAETRVRRIRSEGPLADSVALLKGFEEGLVEGRPYEAKCTSHLAHDGVGVRLRRLENLCFLRCYRLTLHVRVDGCNGFERRHFDETITFLLGWFPKLEALEVDIGGDSIGGPYQGCVPIGRFVAAVPRTLKELRLAFGGASTLFCAANRIHEFLEAARCRLRYLSIEGWAAGAEALSSLRNALRRRMRELDVGISLLGRRDVPEFARLVQSFARPTRPSKLLLRNGVRSEMMGELGRALRAAGCFDYVYTSADEKTITIWLALPEEEKDCQ